MMMLWGLLAKVEYKTFKGYQAFFHFILLTSGKYSLHPGYNLTDGERLCHIVVGSQFEALKCVILCVLCGQEDNWQLTCCWLAFKSFCQFKARHAWHHHIEYQQIEAFTI